MIWRGAFWIGLVWLLMPHQFAPAPGLTGAVLPPTFGTVSGLTGHTEACAAQGAECAERSALSFPAGISPGGLIHLPPMRSLAAVRADIAQSVAARGKAWSIPRLAMLTPGPGPAAPPPSSRP